MHRPEANLTNAFLKHLYEQGAKIVLVQVVAGRTAGDACPLLPEAPLSFVPGK